MAFLDKKKRLGRLPFLGKKIAKSGMGPAKPFNAGNHKTEPLNIFCDFHFWERCMDKTETRTRLNH